MLFYHALRTLAGFLNNVRSDIFGMAVSIRRVWLIGDNLYAWFASISAHMGATVSYVYELADSWLNVYNQLKNIAPTIPGLPTLLFYLDDLLSLVRDFASYLRNGLRQYFPALYNFSLDPVTYILETIYRYTGLTYSFVHSPTAFIVNIVNSSLGGVRELILNPYVYIVNKLSLGNPLLQLLLLQPSLWLRREINILFPYWELFISNPIDFITDAFVSGIERWVDKYGTRLAQVAEKIISNMF